MRLGAATLWLHAAVLAALVGCAQNPVLVQNQVKSLQDQQLALQSQNTELQNRAATLDADNKELQTLLSQAQQQGRLAEEQLVATRDQLKGMTAKVAQAETATKAATGKIEAWTASAKTKVGATITANNSLQGSLPPINIPGVQARVDGDVIRIELPSTNIFAPDTARLTPEADAMLATVASTIARTYPEQMIGIEGHTDNAPFASNRWASRHQLSVGQAMAVYDYLSTRTTLRPEQLFVVAHGANHPIVSNGTPAGQQRNRRVELVVYPDKVTR